MTTGTRVRIVSGTHKGETGVVEQILTHSQQLLVKLDKGRLVTVDIADVEQIKRWRLW